MTVTPAGERALQQRAALAGGPSCELEGLSFLTLWFTRESAAQCEAVVQSYAEGRPMHGAPSEKTRGLYYRTVL